MSVQDSKNLKKRYLIWFYKSAKEALDRIDRKFTQVEVDHVVLSELKKADKKKSLGLSKFIDEFASYVDKKAKEGHALKYDSGVLRPEYDFLALKVKAVEYAIVQEFGSRALREIKSMYEREMTERILKSTEH